jgi:hypothetical protein
MRYVLVPVPSEFVLDVMRWVLFRAQEDSEEDGLADETRLRRMLEDADDLTRALLVVVATATLEDRPLRLSDAAEELDQPAETLRTCLRRTNATTFGGGRELVAVATETAVGPLGRRGKVTYLRMRPGHARTIRALGADRRPEPV